MSSEITIELVNINFFILCLSLNSKLLVITLHILPPEQGFLLNLERQNFQS